ncbi:MAG: hypothetical protein IZT58_12520 [Actinobacteria bacterium]|nr:hypothetical protein [Actinomycetota bacterium]
MLKLPTHTGVVLTSAVTAGLLFASCGVQSEPLSKAEFIEQANAICQSTNDRVEPLFDEVYNNLEDVDWDDPDNKLLLFVRFDEAMDEVLPIMNEQLDSIGALEPPAEDGELIDELIADQDAALTEFAVLMDAAADGDEAALAALDSEEDPFEEIDRRARDYGLIVCGEEDG